jgi:two-component system cell cycle sensor histidine kinase/response regulator CckA
MEEWLKELGSGQFAPHGESYLWRASLLWLHGLSDGLMALGCLLIGGALFFLTRRRPGLPDRRVWLLGAIFFVVCGVAHGWTLWHAQPWVSGLVKAVGGVLVLVLAGAVFRVLPRWRAKAAQRHEAEEQDQGQGLRVGVSVSPIPNASGAGVGCSEVVSDSGERRQQELDRRIQESQKLESLGVLAGGIAHDFNNLLTGILGNASFALRLLPPGAPLAAQLTDIEKAAGRAAELCAQMQAYARRGPVVARPVGLNPLIEETTRLISTSLGAGVKIRLALAPELPAVMADPTQLRQIVLNLVMNAAEAMGEGAGTVTLGTGLREVGAAELAAMRTGPEAKPGPYVFLEVRDTGRGMDAETLGRIFEPFFTTKFTGRGLGLAAVLGIVRGHQGGLRVESAPGRGSTFELVLPPAPELAGEVASGPAGAGERAGTAVAPGAVGPVRDGVREAAGGRSRGRVLVVDDEEPVRHVATRLLEHMGFTVETAVDGREALGRFALDPGRYALVLLDLTMPRLDGAETWRQLRRIRPDVRGVLISGFDQAEVMRRFAGEGLAGFISKPFEPGSFQSAIRAALGG